MHKVLLSLIAMLSLVISTACGQNSRSELTADILQKATSIQYYTDNGTVAPDCHYSVTVIVSRDSVSLTVIKGYGTQATYEQTAPLTAEQYQQFIQELAALSVHNPGADAEPTCGGSAESIRVLEGRNVLFHGGSGTNLTCNGDLGMTFHDVLPNEMAQVFRHPHDL